MESEINSIKKELKEVDKVKLGDDDDDDNHNHQYLSKSFVTFKARTHSVTSLAKLRATLQEHILRNS